MKLKPSRGLFPKSPAKQRRERCAEVGRKGTIHSHVALISRTHSRRPSGEPNVSRRQQTRVPKGSAAGLRHGRGGLGDIRRFGGPAQGRPFERADGAGDATAAIDPGCGDKTFRAGRAGDDGRTSIRSFARVRASRRRGTKGRRHPGAAARSGGKDRGADQGTVILRTPALFRTVIPGRA